MSDDAPQLYLVTPPLQEASNFKSRLVQALEAANLASLLIRFAHEDIRKNEEILRILTPLAQERNVAVLVENGVNEALRCGADGAHIVGSTDDIATAVKKLSPRYIVGAGNLATRDDAMQAGELSVDYVHFVSSDAHQLIERVAWWSELFITPCVAKAERLEEIAPLAQAGADFIMLEDVVWSDPRHPAAALSDALACLQGVSV